MKNYTLKRLLDDLNIGELSQIDLSGKDSDEADDLEFKSRVTVVSHLNFGLTELFTRFPLLEKEVIVQLSPDNQIYVLSSNFAVSNDESTEPVKYILDSKEKPFLDDVLRVDSCYGDSGIEFSINDEHHDYPVYTPDYRSLQVPLNTHEDLLYVIYRANHPDITITKDTLPEDVEIAIPPYVYEALLYYIAYRVHKTRNSQEARAATLQYLQLYNAKCDMLERRNMVHGGTGSTSITLEKNGWV